MSSILLVEPEPRYSERIHAALGADGWRIRLVDSEAALHAAAAERPDLILISAEVPNAENLASQFARRAGGPGVVGLLPETGGPWLEIGADDHLSKPFTDQELRLVVQRNVQKAPAAAPVMLTSADIFGDVLAEVEADLPAQAPAAPRPAAAPPRPSPPLRDDDEINRKLEQTLSGVFGLAGEPKPRTAPVPPKPAAPPPAAPPLRRAESGDVDALLSRTLSTLELGRPKPAAPLPAPAAPPPAPTRVRNTGEIDISALEELARPRRPEPPAKPAPVAPVSAPAPAPPPPIAVAPPPPPPPVAEVLPEPELFAEPLPDLLEDMEPVEAVIEAIPEPPEVPDWPPVPPPVQVPIPAPVGRTVMDAAATQRIQLPSLADLSEAMEGGERFGQYTLLDKIAAGGMAEVWKARMRGVEGFQKTVAIKKILPHMTDNSEFVGMFIDEAKLAAQLSHPNIVHIYDLGKIGRDYYIAMEYVDGKDLRSLMNAGRRKGVRMPLGLALFIAARLASSLDYAHRKRDFEDREMGLVHRDVSPQNVLLSLEGDVKLCDFGIAKAVSKAGQTQMGALKGKLQYMSPEQAWGRAVDARSDLFSLGAVLYEMLTGDRLFTGDTEIGVLESVRQGQIRSTRQTDPSIPAEVDEIVARALAYDPQSRFANAGEMKQRIESVLHTLGLSPDPTDLAAWVHKVLEEEPSSGDWHVPAYPAASPLPAQAAFAPSALSVAAPEPETVPEPEEEEVWAAPEWPPAPEPAQPAQEPVVVAAVAPVGEVHVGETTPRSRNLLYIVIAALVLIAILGFLFLRRPASAPPVPEETPAPSAQAPKPAVPAPVAPAPVTAPATKTPGLSQEEIQKMVDEEMARREASIRQAKEAELRKYQKELERLQAEAKKRKQAADAAASENNDPPQR